jgi:hypothetical protein
MCRVFRRSLLVHQEVHLVVVQEALAQVQEALAQVVAAVEVTSVSKRISNHLKTRWITY